MTMIDGARHWWRLWSVRVSAIGLLTQLLQLIDPGSVLTIWNMMPDQLRALMPERIGLVISVLLFAAVVVFRLIKQKEPDHGE